MKLLKKKICCYILLTAMIVSLLPVSALAEEVDAEITEASEIVEENDTDEAEVSEIVEEVDSEMTEASEIAEEKAYSEGEEETTQPLTCGEGVYYSIDENGVLTIYGDGTMTDYYNDWFAPDPGWAASRESIVKIVIAEGVKAIAGASFGLMYIYPNVKEIEISSTVETIGEYAFYGCYGLEKITLSGNAPAGYSTSLSQGSTSITVSCDAEIAGLDAAPWTNSNVEISRTTEVTELTASSTTAMFKAVSGAIIKDNIKGKTYLRVALSGTGNQVLMPGTYEEASASTEDMNNVDESSWVYYSINEAGKYEFMIPISEGQTVVEIQALSASKYSSGIAAWYSRQFVIDYDAHTLVSGDLEKTEAASVTDNAALGVTNAAIETIAGPIANNYEVKLIAAINSELYTKAYIGTAAEAAEAETVVDRSDDGTFVFSFRKNRIGGVVDFDYLEQETTIAFYNNVTSLWKEYTFTVSKTNLSLIVELSVSPDEEAANAVTEKIDAIGTVTLASEAVITEAREAYDALTENQKALISSETLEKLTSAEARLSELKKAEDELNGTPGATTITKLSNTASGLQITWEKAEKASGYILYKRNANGDYKKFTTIKSGTTLSYVDTTAENGKASYYKVKVYNVYNDKTYYSTASAGKGSVFVTPVKITELTNTENGLQITWNRNSAATGYILYKSDASGSYSKFATIKANTTVSYVDTAVVNGKACHYKVKAYYKGSNTYYSVASSEKGSIFVKKAAIKSVTSSVSGKASVTWAKNSAATSYQISYTNNGVTKTVTVSADTLSKTIKGLTSGKNVSVKVRSLVKGKSATYYGAWSDAVKVKVK